MGNKHCEYDPNQGQLGLDKQPSLTVEAAERDKLFHILSAPEFSEETSSEKDRNIMAVCHATILYADRFGVERSLSLLIIHRRKLYTLWGYDTWEKFVATRYGICRAHAHRLIKHAELCIDLSGGGIRLLPTEIQGRKLLALKVPAEDVRSIWQMASCGVDEVSSKRLDRTIETFFPPEEKQEPKDEPEKEKQVSVQGKAKAHSVTFVPPLELEPVILRLAGEQCLTPQAFIEKLIRDEAQRRESGQPLSSVKSSPESLPGMSESEISNPPGVNADVPALLLRVKTRGSRLKASPKKPLPLKMFENLKKKIA